MIKIRVIHGVNINFTGIREPHIYGNTTLYDINKKIVEKGSELGFEIECFQSNHEGDIVDFLQDCYSNGVYGIVINPGAFTHYSYAIRDAISSISIPTIEVHLSNIYQREDFRHKSVIAPACLGQVSGLGINSYLLAVEAFKTIVRQK